MQRKKTYYSERPDPFHVEPVPDGSVVFLRENIEEVQDPEGGTRFMADEYLIKSRQAADRMWGRVSSAFRLWLEKAKELEAQARAEEAAKLSMEDLAEALVELGELLAEQDDAIVELAELIEEGV